MENLHIELFYPQTSIFRNIINTFRIINKNIFINAKTDSLHLSSISPSRTSWLHISLSKTFFNSFHNLNIKHFNILNNSIDTLNLNNEDQNFPSHISQENLICLPLKPLVKILSNIAPFFVHSNSLLKKKGERTDFSSSLKIDKIILENLMQDKTFKFQFIFKDFECVLAVTFAYQEIENDSMITKPVKWKQRHSFGISPSTLLRIFDTHCCNTEFISLIVNVDKRVIRFQTPQSTVFSTKVNDDESQQINTQNNLVEIELDAGKLKTAKFDLSLPTISTFTFSSQDVKAVTFLCEQLNLPIFLVSQSPGLPIILAFGARWKSFQDENYFSSLLMDNFWSEENQLKVNDRNAWAGMLWSSTIALQNNEVNSAENLLEETSAINPPDETELNLLNKNNIILPRFENNDDLHHLPNDKIINISKDSNVQYEFKELDNTSIVSQQESESHEQTAHLSSLTHHDQYKKVEISQNHIIKSKLQTIAYGDVSLSCSSSDEEQINLNNLSFIDIREALINSKEIELDDDMIGFWSQID